MPIPVAPEITDPNLTGYAASGVTQVSGVAASGDPSSVVSITTQNLTIWGTRVPAGQMYDSSVTLSTVSVSEKVTSTEVILVVQASYSQRKVYGSWRQPNYHQNQTFQFASQKYDAQGVSYGDLTASTLGPTFVITTKTPYYKREVFDSTRHKEIPVSSVTCCTAAAIRYPNHPASAVIDPRPLINDFDKSLIPAKYKGTLMNDGDDTLFEWNTYYYIPGTYGTNKEDMQSIISMIDQVGNDVGSLNLFRLPKANVGTRPWQSGSPSSDTGLQYYDVNRHDYSNL